MGRFKPIFLALLLNSTGVYFFTAPKGFSCFPYTSYFIFLLAVFFLLLDVELKPCRFRKLMNCAEFFIEFILNMVLMEIIMNNFWFPLEMAFLTFLPRVCKIFEFVGLRNLKIFEVFKWHGTLWAASHILSLFFLSCITHATGMVDFAILQNCGGAAFLNDTLKRVFCTRPPQSPCIPCPVIAVHDFPECSDSLPKEIERDIYDDFECDSDFCHCSDNECDY